MRSICDDFAAEADDLAALVCSLDEATWRRPTPAIGWSIADQISHLWFFDQRAALALTDPDGFAEDMGRLLAGGGVDASVVPGRSISGAALFDQWQADRRRLIDIARNVDSRARVPWYGPAMAATSFITARLMEAWAHGQDVADALTLQRQPTARLRHVAHIGVRARRYSFMIHGHQTPEAEPFVELVAPDGELWAWGDDAAGDVVRGSALDFCLVVTQRRHLDDTELVVDGDDAIRWMAIAQAFAGGPGAGRSPVTAG
jgi:uncharacterized protein (TIGR03084 family)